MAFSRSEGVSKPHCWTSEGLDCSSQPEHPCVSQPRNLSRFHNEVVPELPDHSIASFFPLSLPSFLMYFLRGQALSLALKLQIIAKQIHLILKFTV